MDINGKSVFVTRYFRPIKPPEELIENGDASIGTAVCDLLFFKFELKLVKFIISEKFG